MGNYWLCENDKLKSGLGLPQGGALTEFYFESNKWTCKKNLRNLMMPWPTLGRITPKLSLIEWSYTSEFCHVSTELICLVVNDSQNHTDLLKSLERNWSLLLTKWIQIIWTKRDLVENKYLKNQKCWIVFVTCKNLSPLGNPVLIKLFSDYFFDFNIH